MSNQLILSRIQMLLSTNQWPYEYRIELERILNEIVIQMSSEVGVEAPSRINSKKIRHFMDRYLSDGSTRESTKRLAKLIYKIHYLLENISDRSHQAIDGTSSRVKYHTENELNQISHLNTLSTIFFSVGSALISIAIGVWVDAAFQTEPISATAEVLKSVVLPIIVVLGVLCYAGGIWQICARKSMLNTIKKESRELGGSN